MSFLVIHVRPYSFRDDNNKLVEGASVTYLDLTNVPDEGEKGFAPLTISAPLEVAKDFAQVPGHYQMEFKQRRGAKGRPTISLTGALLTGGVSLI